MIWGIKKDEKKKSNSKRSMVVIFVCGGGKASILFTSTRDMVHDGGRWSMLVIRIVPWTDNVVVVVDWNYYLYEMGKRN